MGEGRSSPAVEIQAKRGVAEMARGGDMKEGKARAEEWQRWRDPDAGGMRRQRSGRDAAGVIGKRQQWSSEFRPSTVREEDEGEARCAGQQREDLPRFCPRGQLEISAVPQQ